MIAALIMSDPHKAASVTELLELICSRSTRKKVSVADILEAFGDRAFGALMFVFAAPLVLPMPPGVSAILGAPLSFITFQWMMGRPTLWLPRRVLESTLSMSDFRSIVAKLSPYLEKLERRLKPRLTFMYNQVGDRIMGAVCFLLALIVFLPIPFGNMLPSLSIAAFAIGAAERDGVAAIIGWLTAFVSVGVLVLLSKPIIMAVTVFFTTLIGMFS